MPIPLRSNRRPVERPPPPTEAITLTPDGRPAEAPGTPSSPPPHSSPPPEPPGPRPERPHGDPPDPNAHIRSTPSSGTGALTDTPNARRGANVAGPRAVPPADGPATPPAQRGERPDPNQADPWGATGNRPGDPPGLAAAIAQVGNDGSPHDIMQRFQDQQRLGDREAAQQAAARGDPSDTHGGAAEGGGAGGLPAKAGGGGPTAATSGPGEKPGGGQPTSPSASAGPATERDGRPAGSANPVTGLGAAEEASIGAQRAGNANAVTSVSGGGGSVRPATTPAPSGAAGGSGNKVGGPTPAAADGGGSGGGASARTAPTEPAAPAPPTPATVNEIPTTLAGIGAIRGGPAAPVGALGGGTAARGSSYPAQSPPERVWEGGAFSETSREPPPLRGGPVGAPDTPLPGPAEGSSAAPGVEEVVNGDPNAEILPPPALPRDVEGQEHFDLDSLEPQLADNALEDLGERRNREAEEARDEQWRHENEPVDLSLAPDWPDTRPEPQERARHRPPARHPDPEQVAENLAIVARRQFRQWRAAMVALLEPLSAVVDPIGNWLDEERRIIHRFIHGDRWVRYVLPCKVTAVDREHRLCTVELMLGGQIVEKVKYGIREPALDKEYAARWVNKLPADLHSGSLRDDVSIKVPGGRALYRKDGGMTSLIRYNWPPPDAPDGWSIETVNDHMPSRIFLFGAATAPAPGGQEVVMQDFLPTPAPFREDGAIYEATGTLAAQYIHFADTGAGDQTQAYFTSPYYLRLDAIAYEGYNSVTHHIRYLPIDTGESHYYEPGTPTIRDHFECCLANPFGGEIFCDGITNYDLHWVRHTFPASHDDRRAWTVADHGRLGALSDAQAHPWGAAYVFDSDGTAETQHGTYRLPSGGCHWEYIGPAPIAVKFDHVTTTNFDLPPPGPDVLLSIKQNQPQFDILAANAWYRDEQPREAWVVLQYTFPPFPPSLPPIVDRFFLQTTNLPAAELPVLYPHQGWGDGFITLNPENKVVLWGTNLQGEYHRWTAENPTWRRVTTLGTRPLTGFVVYSPDGQDIIGWTDGTFPTSTHAGTAVQVYTTDGGDHWAPLPGLPSGGRISGNLAFIDAG